LGGAEAAIFFSPPHFGLSPSVVGAGSGAAVAAFAFFPRDKPLLLSSVVTGPAAFFQQPFFRRPHAWDFLRAALSLLQSELSFAVWHRQQVLYGSRPENVP